MRSARPTRASRYHLSQLSDVKLVGTASRTSSNRTPESVAFTSVTPSLSFPSCEIPVKF